MKRFISFLLVTAMTVSIFFAMAISSHGLDDSEMVGFSLDISAPEFYVAGEKVSVSITVNNITAEKGLHYIYGKLYFDSEKLGFDFETQKNKAINAFCGYKEWEDFSVLKIDDDGRWYISVSAGTVGYADSETGEWKASGDIKDGDLIFNINFIAKENSTGDIILDIPDTSIEGSYLDLESSIETIYVGKGSMITISEKADDSSDNNSEDDSVDSSEDSSEDSSVDSSESSSDIPIVKPEIQKGDINANGNLDSMDYLYLKRAYFKQYTLSSDAIGDINGNGSIDSMDYLYLKRAYFKQYVIA